MVTGLVYCSVIEGCQEVYAAAPRPGVDRRPDALVRAAARHGRVHRPLPGAPRRDHAAARRRGPRPWRRRAEPASASAQGMNRVAAAEARLPGGRAAPAARRVRRGRGGLPGGEPARARSRSPAWPCCGWPRGRATSRRPRCAGCSARRPIRSRRVRLLPAYVEIVLAAGDLDEARSACEELEEISATYDSPMLRAMVADAPGAVALADGRRARRAGRSAAGRAGLAGAPGALRGGPRAGAGGSGLPRPGRRGVGRAGARRRARGSSPSSARHPSSLASTALAEPLGRSARIDDARAAGAAPGRGRRDQQGDRGRRWCSASARSTGT